MYLIGQKYYLLFLSFIYIFLCSCSDTSSNPDDKPHLTEIQRANKYYNDNLFDTAIIAFNAAFSHWRQQNQVDSLLKYSIEYAVAFERMQHVKDAYPYFTDLEKRLDKQTHFDSTAYSDFLIAKSIILYNDNKTYESIQSLHRAKEIILRKFTYPDRRISAIYDYLGVGYEQNGDFKNALKYNLLSDQCSKKLKKGTYGDHLYVLGNVSACYYQLGIYDLAEKYSNELIDSITKSKYYKNSSDLVQYYLPKHQQFNILKGNYQTAIATLQIQLENIKKNNNKQSENHIYEMLTNCYQKMGIQDSSLYYASCLYNSLRATTEEQYHQSILDAAILKAEVLSNMGQSGEAFKYLKVADNNARHLSNLGEDSYLNFQYRKALIYLESNSLSSTGIKILGSLSSLYNGQLHLNKDKYGQINMNMADWYFKHRQFNEAETKYSIALLTYIQTRNVNNPDVLNIAANLLDLYITNQQFSNIDSILSLINYQQIDASTIGGVRLQLEFAQYKEQLYYRQLANENEVLAAYKVFNQNYEKIINAYTGYFNPSTIGQYDCSDGLKDAAFFTAKLYTKTNKKEYLKQSFLYSEKYRQTGFRLSIQSKLIRQFNNYPKSLMEKEKDLLNNISFYKNMILGKPKDKYYDDVATKWKAKLIKNHNAYDSLIQVIKITYPEYYKFKFKPFTIDIDSLCKKYSNYNAICTYILRPDEYIQYTISDGHLHIINQMIPASINTILDHEYNIHTMLDPVRFAAISNQLYNCFFKPSEQFLSGNKNLTIAPDLQLANVSFENLVININTGKNLFSKYNISYALSANTTLAQPDINKSEENQFFAPGFDDKMQDSYKLIPQPFILKLGKELEKKFDFTIWLDQQASEQSFRKIAGNANILFIGSHIHINSTNSLESEILLYPSQKVANNDGKLNVRELYGTEIKSNLLVLAGCESGKQGVGMGAGLTSLATAFTYAGSPNMLVSLWPVDEEATANLCRRFIYQLAEGENPKEALYKAKLQYIQDAPTNQKSPFYWSGFVLIGNNSFPLSIKTSHFLTYQVIFSIAGIILALFILFWLRKHRYSRSR